MSNRVANGEQRARMLNERELRTLEIWRAVCLLGTVSIHKKLMWGSTKEGIGGRGRSIPVGTQQETDYIIHDYDGSNWTKFEGMPIIYLYCSPYAKKKYLVLPQEKPIFRRAGKKPLAQHPCSRVRWTKPIPRSKMVALKLLHTAGPFSM